MNRRITTIVLGALLALPLATTAASADGPCKPSGGTCRPPVWCDGTGYSCDAVGLAQYTADQVLGNGDIG